MLPGKGYKKTLQGVGNILYLGGHYTEIHEYIYKIYNHWALYLRVYFMHFNIFVLLQLQNTYKHIQRKRCLNTHSKVVHGGGGERMGVKYGHKKKV